METMRQQENNVVRDAQHCFARRTNFAENGTRRKARRDDAHRRQFEQCEQEDQIALRIRRT